MWETAFSIITAMTWINPRDLKAQNCALREWRFKANVTSKNIKYEKKILRFSVHRNTKVL
jgi:hypothetical protein